MSADTKIEWTDATWNVVTGCEKVSPGCDNCYAETFAERWRGIPGHHFEAGFDVTLRPERLTLPLKWRKPKRVFVNSMSDLFHKDIPDSYIAQVFAIMARTPQHTYQILTKRHGRMRSLVGSLIDGGQSLLEAAPDEETAQALYDTIWPLPNVWLGVSVEDQKRADLRIPALVDTAAAVRFLSCEPLLGPVDLTKWMPPVSPMPPSEAPLKWSEWTWPDWVPAEVRKRIEEFWSEDWGRSPRTWMQDMHQQGAPAFGSVVTLGDGFGQNPPKTTGRFVHSWNNIGRLVRDDGSFAYTSFHHALERRRQQSISWVIVGGESGRRARPMAPQWATALRDQCTAADVPFFFKQFGEYAPTGYLVIGGTRKGVLLAGDPVDDLGHRVEMARVGKKNAGRELDGRTWDEYPTAGESRG